MIFVGLTHELRLCLFLADTHVSVIHMHICCTAVVPSLYSWVGPRCRPSWPQPAPVCRWYAGLRQHRGQGRTSHCVSRRHRGLAEGQQTPAESHQDSGYVVGFSLAAGQSQRLRSASVFDTHQRLRDGAWPRCRHRQSSVAVCTGGGRVSQWLLPTTAAPTARPIHVSRGRKDAGPGVHFVSPGLLQLTVLLHRRRSHELLQFVQNAAARLVSCARHYDRITPVLQVLH